MSIATLKKKTAAKYNNMSVSGPFRNNNGFSLYGGQRNEGYIGKDSLGNSLPKTILKNIQMLKFIIMHHTRSQLLRG